MIITAYSPQKDIRVTLCYKSIQEAWVKNKSLRDFKLVNSNMSLEDYNTSHLLSTPR